MDNLQTATRGLVRVTSTGPLSIRYTDESTDTWDADMIAAILNTCTTDTGLVVDEVHVPARDWVEFATLSCPDDLVAEVGVQTYDAEAVLWICGTLLVTAVFHLAAEVRGRESGEEPV